MAVRNYLVFLLCFPVTSMAGNLLRHQDPDTGLLSWQKLETGFSMRLVQLLPDYVGAVYSARGLPSEIVDIMMGYCIFGTIIRNDSQHTVSYQVADWRYITDNGRVYPIKTKTDWVKEWHDMGVAFRWSILPDNQILGPGDWNQGFTTISLPPGSTLDLVYSWESQGETHESIFKGLSCAPENMPQG